MFKPPVRNRLGDKEAKVSASDKKKSGAALKKLMTKAGFKRLAMEHNELLLVERPKVVQGIATAAAEGDRSENAEYIYGKKRLRELDKRLRYLIFLLRNVRLVDPAVLHGDAVLFGSTVTVRDEGGVDKRYTIVGEGEAEWRNHEISYKSPVARALLGKKVGDAITAHRPAGEIELEIVDLHFGERHHTVAPASDAPDSDKALALPALEGLAGFAEDSDGEEFVDRDEEEFVDEDSDEDSDEKGGGRP